MPRTYIATETFASSYSPNLIVDGVTRATEGDLLLEHHPMFFKPIRKQDANTIRQVVYEAVGQRGALQYLPELVPFLELVAKEKPRTIVEIGVAEGGMLWAMGQVAHPQCYLIGIDSAPESAATYHADSQLESTRDWLAGEVEGIDLLFIDGDHTYDAVKRDHELYAPLVREGGIVAFHDMGQPYAEKLVGWYWDELRPSMNQYWEWCYSGAGIGAYRAPLNKTTRRDGRNA